MDRHQLALECQEVERLGGSVRDFLRGRGAVSPWGTWYRLQIEELGRKNAQITEGVEKRDGVEADPDKGGAGGGRKNDRGRRGSEAVPGKGGFKESERTRIYDPEADGKEEGGGNTETA